MVLPEEIGTAVLMDYYLVSNGISGLKTILIVILP